MEYKENALCYKDYLKLRESVSWKNFSKEQAEQAIKNSLYTITATEGGQAAGMGRLTGDGMYYIIADVIVHPAFQKRGTGSRIINMLVEFVYRKTPPGGRSSIQLIAEKGKEDFYIKAGFKLIPHEFCGSGMRKVIYK